MLTPDEAKAIVESHFRVYESRVEQLQGNQMALLYFIMFPPGEFDRRFADAKRAINEKDPELLVFSRREGGEEILFIASRPPVAPSKNGVHLTLLLLTLATTILAGAISWAGFHPTQPDSIWELFSMTNLLNGALFFALPLMAILGCHEMAHYFAAKKHGLRATLPFFIPIPPFLGLPFGTLGAFISMKDPMPNRRALFDVGASGPLAGFLVAIPVVIAGAMLTGAAAHEVPDIDRPELLVELNGQYEHGEFGAITWTVEDPELGHFWFQLTGAPGSEATDYQVKYTVVAEKATSETATIILQANQSKMRYLEVPDDADSITLEVTWNDGIIQFGDPLFLKGLQMFGLQNDGYLTHPMYVAGWAGLLVTGINLLPIGQLDGGHVARAVFGERAKLAAYAGVAFLATIAIWFDSWILLALFVLLMGIQHPPPLNDRTTLDPKRIAIAVLVLVVFIVTFVPRPIIV